MYDHAQRSTGLPDNNAQFEKELVEKRMAAGSARAASLGTIGGGYADTAEALRPQTVTESLLRELEQACSLLNEAVQRQDEFATRMFGPRPTDPSNKTSPVKPSGTFALVEERISWLRELTQRAFDNACSLTRIG